MRRNIRLAIVFLISISCPELVYSQAHTVTNYKKALWMTTRFYGGQRSGDNNWLLYNHLPGGVNAALRGRAFRADAHTDGNNLSGGWHDCGDHVKFGQTQFYSAYILLKGYSEFPTGYDDRYSYDYAGYKSSNQWTFEGTGHDPNCIPDILDEMKHETDFLIKCIPNATNFYYQVGSGGASADHCEWATAVKTQTNPVNCGGNNDNGTTATPLRPACKNPNDASMASFCGATLALMARMYQPYDAAYAALCLTHAQYAYTYAKAHPGRVGTCFGGFYGANDNWEDDFVTMCAELYWATSNVAYRTEAISYEPTVVFNGGWSFDYSNNGEIALYNLAKLGNASALTRFNNRITGHFMAAGSRNGLGIYSAYGSGWGALRYNANASFLISLYSKLNNNTTAAVMTPLYRDIDYIMGSNSSNRSYIVGFVPAAGYIAASKPHHRNVFLRDDNPGNTDNTLTIPAKNTQFGALVGGQRDASYNDNRNDYVNSEVCIDYNAGLVGALGYINSLQSPVSISCGGNECWKPNMGANISTCNTTLPTTLNANSGAAGGGISYRWYTWDGTTKTLIAGQTASTYSASALGSYIVERDSAYTGGPCTKSDTISITNTYPTPAFTTPLNLCNPSSYNLSPTNLASFPTSTWQWAVDYSGGTSYNNISGETSSTLMNVRRAGRYRLSAQSGSCNSNASVVITSDLATPVDGCRASTGTVNLGITNATGGPYQWFATATSSTSLGTGTTFTTPSISSTTTYYVQDMSAAPGTVGPTSLLGGETSWGLNTGLHLNFTVSQDFTINSLQIPMNVYGNKTSTVTIEILDGSGNSFSPVKSFVSDPTAVTTAQHNSLITFNFTGFTIQSSWGANLRMRLINKGTFDDPLWSSGASYPYNSNPAGIVSITGSTNAANQYNYFYNWQISTGAPCNRLPVIATIGTCGSLPVQLLSFTASGQGNTIMLSWTTGNEINNDYFSIMGSSDGITFTELAKVNGAGNSSMPLSYYFTDMNPGLGLNYYKLIQYDYNATSTESRVITFNKISTAILNVAPNPFDNTTSILLASELEGTAQIIISDVTGKTVEQINDYTINQEIVIGSDLLPGVYVVQIITNDQVVTSSIVKK